MQKKIIALAVAGLASTAAFAQSNVTVYGRMDTYLGHVNATGGTKVGKLENGGIGGSRLGFKGEESLGGGLKAFFVIETHVQSNGNTNITNVPSVTTATGVAALDNHNFRNNRILDTRNAYVGVSGSWGLFGLGRFNTSGMDASIKYDALGASMFSPLYSLNSALTSMHASARSDNVIVYQLPKLGDFTVSLATALAGATGSVVVNGTNNSVNNALVPLVTNRAQETAWALRADYSKGPLDFGYAYARTSDSTNTISSQTGAANNADNHLGISYQFAPVKVFASWQNSTRRAISSTADVKNRIYQLGLSGKVFGGTLSGMYANMNKNDDVTPANSNNDATGVGFQYVYDLSKRTALYAGAQRVSSKAAGQYTVIMDTRVVPTAGGNVAAYGAGLYHTF